MRWVRRGGGAEKIYQRCQFVCIIECKQKLGEKIVNTMVQKNAYNSTTMYLFRYVYIVIFVSLHLCSSNKLLYTLTTYIHTSKYVRSDLKTNNNSKVVSGFCEQFLHNHATIYT